MSEGSHGAVRPHLYVPHQGRCLMANDHYRRPIDLSSLSDFDRERLEERLRSHSEWVDDCLLWTASTGSNGYGKMRVGNRDHNSHRVAYAVWVGINSSDQDIDHACRVRLCINPAHLEGVSHRTNLLRARGVPGNFAARTECRNGHNFAENGYINGRGNRTCRVCKGAQQRAYRARRRVAKEAA